MSVAPYRLVLCLPKTGSTSLAQWLQAQGQQARHEWQTLAVLQLAALSHRGDFDQRRELWLRHRAQQLQGDWDVNTALYAVLADRQPLAGVDPPLQVRWLCRSPRPWLRSIVAWSLRHGDDPHRRRWLRLHHGFVLRCDPQLAAAMPPNPDSAERLLRYWLPVWIALQQVLLQRQQPYQLTDQLPRRHHANASVLPPGLAAHLDGLLPPLPALTGSATADAACLQTCRRWWDQLAGSSG